MPAAENIPDVVAGVTKALGRMKITDAVSSRTKYIGYQDFLRSSKPKWNGTYGVNRQMLLATPGNASFTSPYKVVALDNVDTVKSVTAPMRFARTGWTISEMVIAMNAGGNDAEKIIDLVQTQRLGCMIDLIEMLELAFWSKPSSSSDEVTPYGVQYWIVWTGGNAFDGGTPSGFSDVGGLSPTTYANLKNWSGTYTAFIEDDFFDVLRNALTLTDFEPPVEVPEYGQGMTAMQALYGGITMRNELVKAYRAQNENLALELLGIGKIPVLNGIPFKYVPTLDDTTIVNSGSMPLYGIDWSTLEIHGVKGFNMKEYASLRHPDQPDVVKTHIIHSGIQTLMNNRRKNFVLAKSQPTP